MQPQAQISSAVHKINPLSIRQREAALLRARMAVAGDEPQLTAYQKHTVSRFPPHVTLTITRLSLVVLAAAFFTSAVRLFMLGAEEFVKIIGTPVVGEQSSEPNWLVMIAGVIAGVATVLLAEAGQVIFTLAAAKIEPKADDGTLSRWERVQWQKVVLYLGAAICTVIAFLANAEKTQLGAYLTEPWRWVETVAPPLLVLIVSQVLKHQMVDAITDHYAAQQKHAAEHADWIMRRDNAHVDGSWMRHAANQLWDALREANKRSPKTLRDLTDEEKRWLVLRELHAEFWYERMDVSTQPPALPEPETQPIDTQDVVSYTQPDGTQIEPRTRTRVTQPAALPARRSTQVGKASGTHTGELDNAVTQHADNQFEATCPDCGTAFDGETLRTAKNRLVAHTRHCVARNARLNAAPVSARTEIISQAEQVIEEVSGETVSD